MKEQSENNDLNKKFENFSYPVDHTLWDAIAARIPSGSEGGFLGEKFTTHTVTPSRRVWSEIDSVLRPSSRKRLGAWWWYGAAAAVLLFGYFGFYQFTPPAYRSGIAQTAMDTINDQKSNAETAIGDTASGRLYNDHFTSDSTSAKANTRPATTTSTDKIKKHPQPGSYASGRLLQPSGNDEANEVHSIAALAKSRGEGRNFTTSHPGNNGMIATKIMPFDSQIDLPVPAIASPGEMIANAPPVESPAEKRKKSSPFYDGTETISTNHLAILAGSQLAFGDNSDMMNMSPTNSPGVSAGNGLNEEAGYNFSSFPSSVKHSTPVYYGLNGEYKFWNRLSVGTGIGYLGMRSTTDIHYGLESITRERESKYLSVPIYLKFNFVDRPRFTAYTSAGNAIDFLIWNETTQVYTNGSLSESRSVKDETTGNQANVYAGLGMSFKFTGNLGIFAEGSLMRYYSITGTNFYSRQDLWPGMRFGVLVSF